MKRKIFILCLFFSFSYFSSLHAAVPDSGSILREQQQLELPSQQPSAPPTEIKKTKEFKKDPGIKITIRKFKFIDYKGTVSLKELNKLTLPYINKEVTFSDLQNIIQEVTQYLREDKGFLLSRAYLPEQDITQGVITVAIMIGSLEEKVDVSIQGSHRIKKKVLENIANQAISRDDVILSNDVERAVLLINDLPGISAKAYLDKGQTPGTSRITIESKEGSVISSSLSADNFGNRYTGTVRRVFRTSFANLLRCADFVQLTYVNADDLNQGRFDFSIPVGSNGTIFDLSYSGLHYELGGKLKNLKANGLAHTATTGFRYPLRRTRRSSIWGGLGYQHYALEDKIDKSITSDRAINTGNVNVTGNFYDDFLGGGLTSFLFSLHRGYLDFYVGKTNDDAGAKTAGHYSKITYALARLQKIAKEISLFFSARGQFADGNLDSSQKIILGGPTGVRAYPIGEASGDEGHILTLEKRFDLPVNPCGMKVQLVGFFDAGFIRLHKNTWKNSVTNISGRNHYWLTGAGPGINIKKGDWLSLQFSYAHTIGKNVGRDTLGNNADNRHDKGRFWAQATFKF